VDELYVIALSTLLAYNACRDCDVPGRHLRKRAIAQLLEHNLSMMDIRLMSS
jgi:hypothetical protein